MRAALLAIALCTAFIATPAAANDGPGFYWGIDSRGPTVSGSAPYQMPYVDPQSPGKLGTYIGEIGSWAHWQGCGGRLAELTLNDPDYRAANTNYFDYHKGIGSSVYWMAAGPGLNPATPGRMPTANEAYQWGKRQAQRAVWALRQSHYRVPAHFIVLDVEIPGVTPATDNGWNHVYEGKCGGRQVTSYIPASIDRATFNGFYDYVMNETAYYPVVYSGPSMWTSIFGAGSISKIPNTYEWTFEAATSNVTDGPRSFCRGSLCAQFFGGQTRANKHALIWQWSTYGQQSYGDFDQVAQTRVPMQKQ